MLRSWMLAICMGFVVLATAQTSSNPFDLTFRKPIPTNVPVKAPDTAQAKPLFSTPAAVTLNPNPTIHEDTSITLLGKSTDTTRTPSSSNPFEKNASDSAAVAAPNTDTLQSPTKATTTAQKTPTPHISRGFQIFFLLLSLLFLIFIVNVERSFVRDLWRVIANENYSSLHHRNQRNTMRQILLLMGYAVFIFQAGIFIFNALRTFGYNGPVELNIWLPMIFVLVVYIIRHTTISYLRWLFNNQKEMTLFGFDISIFNTMVGLILLPINILILFGPESMIKPLIIIGLIAFIAAYLMRQLRWMFTARQLIVNSLFLFFIYLCAVEIFPLWAVSKYFW